MVFTGWAMWVGLALVGLPFLLGTRKKWDYFCLIAALSPLIGAISVERMRQANLMVDRDTDKRTPAEAALWLDPDAIRR